MALVLTRALALGLALGALAGCTSAVTTPPPPAVPGVYQSMSKPGSNLDRRAAAEMVSAFRTANGLSPVSLDSDLNRMAEEQAAAMARADKLSHSVAGSFKERIARSGVRNGGMVENIGAGHDTLADAFTGWRSSPPHMKNMLMAKAGRMGIAAVRAPHSRYEVFWAMVLSDPNDPRPIAGAAPDRTRSARLSNDTLTINGMPVPR